MNLFLNILPHDCKFYEENAFLFFLISENILKPKHLGVTAMLNLDERLLKRNYNQRYFLCSRKKEC